MDFSNHLLGRHVASTLRFKALSVVLTIGADTFDRADLAAVSCFNYNAAATLDRILQGVDIEDTRDLYEHVPPSRFVLPGVGPVTLAVLGAAFEAKGLGGTSPLERWVRKHAATADDRQGHQGLVTFATMKARQTALLLAGEPPQATRRGSARRRRVLHMRHGAA